MKIEIKKFKDQKMGNKAKLIKDGFKDNDIIMLVGHNRVVPFAIRRRDFTIENMALYINKAFQVLERDYPELEDKKVMKSRKKFKVFPKWSKIYSHPLIKKALKEIYKLTKTK